VLAHGFHPLPRQPAAEHEQDSGQQDARLLQAREQLAINVAKVIADNRLDAIVYKSVEQQPLLVKHQLLILNRFRKRSPNLRVSDRMVAGLCALLIRGSADPFRDRPETLNALEAPSGAEETEISPAVLAQSPEEAGSQGSEPRSHCRRRRHETAESELGVCPRGESHRASRNSVAGVRARRASRTAAKKR
jgi:hypothetical protein